MLLMSRSPARTPTPISRGNGLQDVQLLNQDYKSVYTSPTRRKNESYLVNLVVMHKLSDTIALSGNAHYRNIQTRTLNGDLKRRLARRSLCINRMPTSRRRPRTAWLHRLSGPAAKPRPTRPSRPGAVIAELR